MSTFDAFLETQTSSALDTLAGFDRDAALSAGIRPKSVTEWGTVHAVYFGPTKWTAQQRRAANRARARRMSIDQLALIESQLQRVKDPRTKWEVRLELLGVRGGYEAVRRKAKELIPEKTKRPRKQVRFSASRQGMRTMSVTAAERDLADLEHALARGIDRSRPVAEQMHDRFIELIRGGGSIPTAAPRPIIAVPMPAWCRIIRGEGDEIVLGLSDGTTITGAEYLRRHVGDELEVALFHPQEGPVNLYRGARLANQKQRDLARATTLVCPVPGCRHGADACEIHHIQAWKHGGETNLANLAPLCKYHNGVNDDDPYRKRRGRIERIRGAPIWRSPRGYPVVNGHNRYGAMHSLFGHGG